MSHEPPAPKNQAIAAPCILPSIPLLITSLKTGLIITGKTPATFRSSIASPA